MPTVSLQRGKTLSQTEGPEHDSKPPESKAQSLLPGPLRPGAVVPVRVLFIGQIKIFNDFLCLKPLTYLEAVVQHFSHGNSNLETI